MLIILHLLTYLISYFLPDFSQYLPLFAPRYQPIINDCCVPYIYINLIFQTTKVFFTIINDFSTSCMFFFMKWMAWKYFDNVSLKFEKMELIFHKKPLSKMFDNHSKQSNSSNMIHLYLLSFSGLQHFLFNKMIVQKMSLYISGFKFQACLSSGWGPGFSPSPFLLTQFSKSKSHILIFSSWSFFGCGFGLGPFPSK